MRVADDISKRMVIKNGGKYEVQFKFSIRSAAVRELVSISPEEGPIPPGKDAVIQVRHRPYKMLTHLLCMQTCSIGR